MVRYYDQVGGLFTHLADNSDVAYFTVDAAANGINVPVTSTAKLIRILKKVFKLYFRTQIINSFSSINIIRNIPTIILYFYFI